MKKHPEFELSYDMMLGIRTVVGRVEGGLETSSENTFQTTRVSISTSSSSSSKFANWQTSTSDIW